MPRFWSAIIVEVGWSSGLEMNCCRRFEEFQATQDDMNYFASSLTQESLSLGSGPLLSSAEVTDDLSHQRTFVLQPNMKSHPIDKAISNFGFLPTK